MLCISWQVSFISIIEGVAVTAPYARSWTVSSIHWKPGVFGSFLGTFRISSMVSGSQRCFDQRARRKQGAGLQEHWISNDPSWVRLRFWSLMMSITGQKSQAEEGRCIGFRISKKRKRTVEFLPAVGNLTNRRHATPWRGCRTRRSPTGIRTLTTTSWG